MKSSDASTGVAQAVVRDSTTSPPLIGLFTSFLGLGVTAFGGPAMVAYIRHMAAEKRGWLDPDSFDGGIALCQAIPGATAVQTAAYVGLHVRGVAGAVASFVGFGLPAFALRSSTELGSWVGVGQRGGVWLVGDQPGVRCRTTANALGPANIRRHQEGITPSPA